MKNSDIILMAKAKIQDEKNWTKGVTARNIYGKAVGSSTPDAVCFCSMGAFLNMNRNPDPDTGRLAWGAFKYLQSAVFPYAVPDFNDNRNHAEVLAAFDKAYALAKADEKMDELNVV